MACQVAIIGTFHTFQVGGEDCPQEDAEQFREYFLSVCRKIQPKRIAEEMNTEGLVRYQAQITIPQSVAEEISISYLACDPSSEQRLVWGIWGTGNVYIHAHQNNLGEAEKQSLIAQDWLKREEYWLKCLLDSPIWPTLFVCGSDHAPRFYELLCRKGVHVQLFVAEWAPDKITNNEPTSPDAA